MLIDNNSAACPWPSIWLSIIIPVLNESPLLKPALLALAPLRTRGAQVIVVDGGSEDDTMALARASGLADTVLLAERGRALQMNAGAGSASGEVLMFLHIDTHLPANADLAVYQALAGMSGWGRFDVRIEGRHWLLPVVAGGMNWRSRVTGIATGDQTLFVSKALFHQCGGFPLLPLMEDIAFSRVLKRHAVPLSLREKVTTSGRRWERRGVMRTIVLMWWLRLAYYFGVSPYRLAGSYSSSRQAQAHAPGA